MMKLKLFGILLAVSAVFLSACGVSQADRDEIISALTELQPQANEIYKTVYNDYLPHSETANDSGYFEVSPDCVYKSTSDISTAVSRIFTPDFSKILFNTAFNTAESESSFLKPKYIDYNGKLFVNPSVTDGFSPPQTLDISGADVVEVKANMARVIFKTSQGKDFPVNLKKINGVWLLDGVFY